MTGGASVHQFPTSDAGVTLKQAVDSFLGRDLQPSSRRVYGLTLNKLLADLGEKRAIATVTLDELEAHLVARYGDTSPATYNRNLATIGSLFNDARRHSWIVTSPGENLERRKERRTTEQLARAQVISEEELATLTRDSSIPLRERLLWQMLYDTAARANEILGLDITDLNLAEKEAVVIGKGGDAEYVVWTSATARLLPRYLDGRTSGPLFLSTRRPPPARTPARRDLDPETGLSRLSYRRAAELFGHYSAGRTLHKLRHSALTHLAERERNLASVKAKSRHRSLRSLERYVNPSRQHVKDITDRNDPNRRHS